MMLSQALQYPFQGKGSFRSILTLALIQLLPIVGQLILLGYGLDVVRAVYAGRTSLPPLRWLAALGNGSRILLTGFAYITPILVTSGIVWASTSGTGSGRISNVAGILGIVLSVGLPLLLILIRAISKKRAGASSVQQSRARGGGLRALLGGLLSILMTVVVTFILNALVANSGIESGKPNGLGFVVLLLLLLFLFFVGIVVCIGGVRYAIENKGLLDPLNNAKLLLRDRALTATLFLSVFLLYVVTVIATAIGLVLFIVPGLFAFVICSLALWYMFAQYTMRVGMYKPVFTFTRSTASTL